jgi:hypothetical protein
MFKNSHNFLMKKNSKKKKFNYFYQKFIEPTKVRSSKDQS